jgi:diaminopimelate epimerase
VDTNSFALELGGETFQAGAANVGNPHCVLFEGNADTAPVAQIGPRIETHAMFPARTNVEFVTVKDRTHLRMRVWERGAGITSACGTGACAAVVASHRRGLTDRRVEVLLDGGPLFIEWRESDGHVLMTGPATLAFKGEVDLKDYAA